MLAHCQVLNGYYGARGAGEKGGTGVGGDERKHV